MYIIVNLTFWELFGKKVLQKKSLSEINGLFITKALWTLIVNYEISLYFSRQ